MFVIIAAAAFAILFSGISYAAWSGRWIWAAVAGVPAAVAVTGCAIRYSFALAGRPDLSPDQGWHRIAAAAIAIGTPIALLLELFAALALDPRGRRRPPGDEGEG